MLSTIEKLKLFPAAISYAFSSLTVNEKIIFINGIVFFFSSFNLSLPMPFIFYKIIIPNLEKKFGKKIIYPDYIKYIVFGSYMYNYLFVAKHIMVTYLRYLFFGIKEVRRRGVLSPLGYTIDNASKAEIAMSFIVYINQYALAISLILVILAKHNVF